MARSARFGFFSNPDKITYFNLGGSWLVKNDSKIVGHTSVRFFKILLKILLIAFKKEGKKHPKTKMTRAGSISGQVRYTHTLAYVHLQVYTYSLEKNRKK